MSRNGSGTYTLPAGNPVVTGTTISSSVHNSTMTDIADELTNSVDKDGQTVITGDIDYNGNALILDADGDSKIEASTDDRLDVTLGGVLSLSLTSAQAVLLDDIANLTPADSKFVVGNGTTFVAESGATARTSLGVELTTKGTILAGDGTAPAVLGAGTDGYILTTDAAQTTGIKWAEPSTGALVLLSTVTASASATADIETTFDSTYDAYVIIATGVVPATDGAILQALLKVGGSYQTSSYFYVASCPRSDSASYAGVVSQTGAHIQIGEPAGSSNETDGGIHLEMKVLEPSQTTRRKHIYWQASNNAPIGNSSRHSALSGSARYNGSAAALTGVRFQFSSGNIATGTFRLYGIAKS